MAMSAYNVHQSFKKLSDKLGQGEDEEDKSAANEEEARQEAIREAEEKRKEQRKKMHEEREQMRQSIRDKYGLKKKEEDPWYNQATGQSSINRKDTSELERKKSTADKQTADTKRSNNNKCILQ